MMEQQLYPIGIQTFSKIRNGNFLYVDKTEYVYKMTRPGSPYVFLSRPRRFGKSLLTSTLHCYFEGRKELFKGLAIEKLEKEWTQYPVLHFDMSTAKHMTKATLLSELERKLTKYEKIYGRAGEDKEVNQRLEGLIHRAYEQTGKEVVLLVDEYDAPLLDVVHEDEHLNELRNIMRNFYSPLKACDPYLRFVFLTGITKFSQMSIFSEFNNINNISMDEEYAAICGITQEEMEQHMQPGIQRIADVKGTTYEDALHQLKTNYDGYHFTIPSPDIYNPFSLLCALDKAKIGSYWFASGTPTYLIEILKKYNYTPIRLDEECEAMAGDFDAPITRFTKIIPLLYQSGYITIKSYDPMFGSYTLGIPNREVRLGLMKSLIPYYLTSETQLTSSYVLKMARALNKGDINGMLVVLQSFLSSIPYASNTHYEGHYQQVLYIIFSLIGEFVDVEIRTPNGRIDMVLRTATHLYVMELKLNKDAATAMNQINLKEYDKRFALCGLPIVKVGINFDSDKHTITDWQIEG